MARLIKVNLRCERCKYNLRGLSGDSLCPECGTPIRDSVRHRAAIQKRRSRSQWPLTFAALVLYFLIQSTWTILILSNLDYFIDSVETWFASLFIIPLILAGTILTWTGLCRRIQYAPTFVLIIGLGSISLGDYAVVYLSTGGFGVGV